MRALDKLEARIKELNLGLMQPDPTQIWRLPEPVSEAPASHAGPQYAAQATQAATVP